jgi:hypothetical protein
MASSICAAYWAKTDVLLIDGSGTEKDNQDTECHPSLHL